MTKAVTLQNAFLGIELGSTRIKAVLIDADYQVLASGVCDWENQYEDGYWTYALNDIWHGVQTAYANLAAQVLKRYTTPLTKVAAAGVSGMMHGYLPFDKSDALLVPFRTWRNTTTQQSAKQLTKLFNFNIPQRWSIAHLQQAILNGEEHVQHIAYLTTLAGYIHWQLTDEKVLGVGEASGMFPIDSETTDYNNEMLTQFDTLNAEKGFGWKTREIFPTVLCAGQSAGVLTEKGAALLDPTGILQAGIPFCPPEGDAGTGMVATNSVAPRTGNVSAGTSVFAMVVLEKALSRVYPEIDMVTTPTGSPVAMAHCNTCTSDLDAWVKLFGEMCTAAGAKLSKTELYDLFYQKAMDADANCGGLINFNYYAGEPVTGVAEGRPLFVRRSNASLTLANFARCQLYSAIATLKIGMDTLMNKEHVCLETLLGHGGLFKTPLVGQTLLAGALNVPVAVMETAGEGGAWGIAVLAAYMKNKAAGEALEVYLAKNVFADTRAVTIPPNAENTQGFARFLAEYKNCIAVENAAVNALQ